LTRCLFVGFTSIETRNRLRK